MIAAYLIHSSHILPMTYSFGSTPQYQGFTTSRMPRFISISVFNSVLEQKKKQPAHVGPRDVVEPAAD